MEGLNVAIVYVMACIVLRGTRIGHHEFRVSHFFKKILDDVFFLVKWSQQIPFNIVWILRCFCLAFGVKVKFVEIEYSWRWNGLG